jgi:hypothetical protein
MFIKPHYTPKIQRSFPPLDARKFYSPGKQNNRYTAQGKYKMSQMNFAGVWFSCILKHDAAIII